MKLILFTVALFAGLSAYASTKAPYLECYVGHDITKDTQIVKFEFSQFKDTMLASKSVKLDDGNTVDLQAGFVPKGKETPAAGFLEIQVISSKGEILADSRHNLDMNIRDVYFKVKGLAYVQCLPASDETATAK